MVDVITFSIESPLHSLRTHEEMDPTSYQGES